MTPTASMTAPPKLTLRPYQLEAVDFLHEHKSACLFLDMGLGKSAITLSALTPEHLPALVTAPPRVVRSVWPQETALWRPDLTCVVAEGAHAADVLDGTIPADIVAIPRDQLGKVKAKHQKRFKTFIIDEISGMKSRTTNRFKHSRAITRDMPHVWGLTGTPSPNGLLDLWPQMFLIDRGECLGTTLGSFRSRYFTEGGRLPSGVVTSWNLRPGAATRIHERLKPRALSMGTEGRVNLPPVTTNDIMIDLPPKIRTAYTQFKDDLVMTALEEGTFTAGNAAILSNKLRQMASGVLYPDDRDPKDESYTRLHTEKLKAAAELIDSAQGSPVLMAYSLRSELAELRKEFPQAQTLDNDQTIVDWNTGSIPILLVHPASAGHGLNLQQGGHTMCWYSLPWSLEEYQQTNKRLARSGQKHPVVIHHILARDTVEDKVMKPSLRNKESIQSNLLSYLDPEGIL